MGKGVGRWSCLVVDGGVVVEVVFLEDLCGDE